MPTKMSGESACMHAIHLIEEQLEVLPVSIAAILYTADVGKIESSLLSDLLLRRKPRPPKTGSGGNIVAQEAEPVDPIDFREASQHLRAHPRERMDYVRVVINNAILAVGIFMRENNMANMRTPEIQFLGHLVNAIINEGRFKISDGYMPMATFDGHVINNNLDGKPLFDTEEEEGFLEFGDAVALLQWLLRYLRGEKKFITGGDAG